MYATKILPVSPMTILHYATLTISRPVVSPNCYTILYIILCFVLWSKYSYFMKTETVETNFYYKNSFSKNICLLVLVIFYFMIKNSTKY